MTNGSLMKVNSIAECPPWSILQYVWPSLSDNWSWKPIYGLWEWPCCVRFYCTYMYIWASTWDFEWTGKTEMSLCRVFTAHTLWIRKKRHRRSRLASFYSCFKNILLLAPWEIFHVFSSPEPKAHEWANSIPVTPASVRRPSSVNIFKHLLLWNHWGNWAQILYGDSLGRGNESLFKWSWSHDQDGRHAHIW